MATPNNLINAGEGVQLAVPPTWKRNAMVVFSNGEEGEKGASVVVRRESIDPRTTLQQYMDGMLVEFARTMPEFALIDRRSRTLGSVPAGEFLYTLTARGVEYEQRQVVAIDMKGSVVSIVMSATRKGVREIQPLWDEILATATVTPPADPNRP
ncbi:DcrB-related protein [Nannocystis bainbridge]|uniref:DcrB-related protein n=1 Tax=Nannocystis bainbridge TaxID=2995303 RepID=A0ABT5DQH2_9BACT|nr:DcrB-related protein [Nannocystis bainbridge]MDC0715791.1 DcrB-related protein [Nannocystis bainbridge]